MFSLESDSITQVHEMDNLPFNAYISNHRIEIITHTPTFLEFDLINADFSIANALRRILISEIPTMAIHTVTINKYEGVMPEEIISHRLGLIPILADPTKFRYKETDHDEFSALVFKLQVKCDADEMTVYSDDIVNVPIGSQLSRLGEISVKAGIPITKLVKGQCIDFDLVAEKNIGKEHIKHSPVCPASYRLMPIIEVKDIYGDEAHKLKECFSVGVIDVVDGKGVVINPRLETMSREVFRHKEFEGKVFLGKKQNHFIFTIESAWMDPKILLRQSIMILAEKCRRLRNEIEEYKN